MFKKFIFIILLVTCSPSALCGSLIEDGAYSVLESVLVESGKSNFEASCIVNVMKFMGTTNDVTAIHNIVQPDKMLEILRTKGNAAETFCAIFPAIFFLLLLILFCACCCTCCCRCCRSPPAVSRVILGTYPIEMREGRKNSSDGVRLNP
ncbi:CLUMA_CG019016, isoform A [Clunio marinus]|uniref:CLUMA_CG019016, isoform A n=1 Tax=Clunio marinus TaxID=568069 RepID=A0A1J1J5S0_9DIPT|nr:CLUMA_CG019016, isoform A [Clunio marinus]